MAEIKFTIPDAKFQECVNAIVEVFPLPTNPDGSIIGDWNNATWAREVIRKNIITLIARGKQIAQQKTITFNPDDSLLS